MGDLFTYSAPMLASAADAVRSGALPLWNPFVANGHPQLASVAGGALYPFHAIALLLPTLVALEVIAIIHLALAAGFSFGFGRALGLGRIPAMGAGIAYASSGFVVGQATWFPPALEACVWLPLALWCVERIVTGGRPAWSVGLGLAMAMPILAGWLQSWLYAAFAVGLYAGASLVALARRRRWLECRRIVMQLALGALLAACFAAPQLLPGIELRGLTGYMPGGLSARELISPGGTIPLARFASDVLDPAPKFMKLHYVGLVPLLLFPIALLSPMAGRVRWGIALITLLGAGGTLILATPMRDPWLALPTLNWFRVPQRIIFLYAFGLSMSCGIALHWLANREAGSEPPRRLWVGIAIAAAIPIAAWITVVTARVAMILCAVLLALFVAASLLRRPAQRATVVAILVAMLAWDGYFSTENRTKRPFQVPEIYRAEADVYDFLRRHQELSRSYFRPDGIHDYRMMPKRTLLERVYGIQDYEPLSLDRRVHFFEGMGPISKQADFFATTGWPRVDPEAAGFARLDLMSVRYAVVRTADRSFRNALDARASSGRKWKIVYRSISRQIVIYENPTPRPRSYFATRVIDAPDESAALGALSHASFDPDRDVVLERSDAPKTPIPWKTLPPWLDGRLDGPPGDAQVRSYSAREVVIDAETEHDAVLVLTDTFYPGWGATVDGERVPIHRANSIGRAVVVPAGKHRVVFQYTAGPFWLGSGALAAGVVAAGWVLWRSRAA